jgi:hypothetical protein
MIKHKNKFIIIFIATIFFSCKSDNQNNFSGSKDFIENIIDLQINNKGNNIIELPDISDSLVTIIKTDTSENLVLVNALKKRGFKVIKWGRGNYPPCGSRIVSLTLKKDSCFCAVNKIYYSTINDSLFRISENIRCGDSLSIFK